MTLFDPIEFNARANPERLALVAFDAFAEGLSYADLARLIEGAMHLLVRRGVTPQQRVAIDFKDRFMQIITALALSRMGVSAIVAADKGAFALGTIDALISDQPQAAGFERTLVLEAASLVRFNPDGRPLVSPPRNTSKPVWRFGTERQPELAIGEDAFAARVAQRGRTKGAGSTARWLCLASVKTELGFSAVVESLSAAGAVVLSNGSFEDDIQAMGLYEADHLLIPADMAADYLSIFDQTTKISARIRTAIVSGAKFNEESAARVKQRVSANTVLHLDLPETGTFAACSYWHIGRPWSYWPAPGAELRIVAGSGEGVEPGVAGTVAIRSSGALCPEPGDRPQTALKDGWFRSTLVGSLAPGGSLTLQSQA